MHQRPDRQARASTISIVDDSKRVRTEAYRAEVIQHGETMVAGVEMAELGEAHGMATARLAGAEGGFYVVPRTGFRSLGGLRDPGAGRHPRHWRLRDLQTVDAR